MAIVYIILFLVCGVPFLLAIFEGAAHITTKGVDYVLNGDKDKKKPDQRK